MVSLYINEFVKETFKVINYMDNKLLVLNKYDEFSDEYDPTEYIVNYENVARRGNLAEEKYIDENKRTHEDQKIFQNAMMGQNMMNQNDNMMGINLNQNMNLYPIGETVYYYYMPNVLGEFIVKKHINNVFVQIENINDKYNYIVNFDNITHASNPSYMQILEKTKINNNQKQKPFLEKEDSGPVTPSYDPDVPPGYSGPVTPDYDPDVPPGYSGPVTPDYDPDVPPGQNNLSNEDLLGLKKTLTKTQDDEKKENKFIVKNDSVKWESNQEDKPDIVEKDEPITDLKSLDEPITDLKSLDEIKDVTTDPDKELDDALSSSNKNINLVIKKKE